MNVAEVLVATGGVGQSLVGRAQVDDVATLGPLLQIVRVVAKVGVFLGGDFAHGIALDVALQKVLQPAEFRWGEVLSLVGVGGNGCQGSVRAKGESKTVTKSREERARCGEELLPVVQLLAKAVRRGKR